MDTKPPLTPSAVVFSAAKSIAKDMKEMILAMGEDIDDYAYILDNMIKAFRDVRKNLEQHALPMCPKRSRSKKILKRKIAEISLAMKIAKKIRNILDLTTDDIGDVLGALSTNSHIDKILEPTDEDLRKIDRELGEDRE